MNKIEEIVTIIYIIVLFAGIIATLVDIKIKLKNIKEFKNNGRKF